MTIFIKSITTWYMIRKIAIFMLLTISIVGCGKPTNDNPKSIYVSITPLKMLVEEITCGDFNVEVLVPEGASPETYDPTARQLTAVNDAEMLFSTGLITFEQNLVSRLADNKCVIDLSQGIELLKGSCTHNHCNHQHGIDPHIWTSPRALYIMTSTMRNAIVELYPDSVKYNEAAEQLLKRIADVDAECSQKIASSDVKSFMIYHPAYTYYARDYNIQQVAIEQDGKEPSPRRLATLVEQAHDANIRNIMIQPQYNIDKVLPLAKECGAEVVVTDPLAADILTEIRRVTEIICNNNAE